MSELGEEEYRWISHQRCEGNIKFSASVMHVIACIGYPFCEDDVSKEHEMSLLSLSLSLSPSLLHDVNEHIPSCTFR